MQMMSDEAWKVCQRNGDIDSEHPEHSKVIWIEEAMHGQTIIGYWDWVVMRIAKEESK